MLVKFNSLAHSDVLELELLLARFLANYFLVGERLSASDLGGGEQYLLTLICPSAHARIVTDAAVLLFGVLRDALAFLHDTHDSDLGLAQGISA